MAVNKIVVKKVVVGTPIRRVTAGAFALSNLGGVTIGGESDGSILAFQTSTGDYVTTKLKGQENIRAVYDSSNNRYTFSFRGDSYLGDFIPAADSAQSLGSPNFKWKDLYLSGGTVHLGGLQLKDSSGNFTVVDSATGTTLLTNPKFLNIRGRANVLTYDSATSTFTFDDSDMARTNIAETFHQGLTILNGITIDSGTVTGDFNINGNLNVTGDLVYDDMTADSATFAGTVTVGTNVTSPLGKISQFTSDSASITTITNTNLTGSQATFDSADVGTLRVTGNATVSGNLDITGDLTFDDLSADSATFSGNLAVGNNITSASAKIDSADIRQLSVDFINADSAFMDSATITNLAVTQLTISQGTFDSARIPTIDNTTFRGSQATFDSVNITTLNATNLTLSSASVTDLTADSAKIGGIDLTGNNLTTTGKLFYANVFNNEVDLPSATTYHGMFAHVHATGRGYFAHAGAWHKLIDSDTTGVQQVYTLKSNFADIDSATIDSATITTLTNTNLISSQATFDSANVASLGKVASVDATTTSTIRGLFSVSGDLTYNSGTGQFSIDVEDIYTKANFDSDLGDANTGQLPEGSNLYYTSARADSDAKNAVSVTDAGGDGSLAYNAGTGVFTYTGPSAAEVRSHINVSGDLAYDSSAGQISFTQRTDAQVRGLVSGNKGLTYNSSTGEFNVDSANLVTLSRNALQSGTGVTYDSASGQISIGQDVSTTSDVTFGKIHADSAELQLVDFDTTVSGHAPYKEGRIFYDNTGKTLNYYDDITNVVHELGVAEHVRVFNNTGAVIQKGKPLYFSGNYTSGAIDVPTVGLADATDVNAYDAEGLAEADIPNNSYGNIITAGHLTEVNTSALTAGTNFFLGLGPGLLQDTSPVYPNFPMSLGWVVNSGDSNNGVLLVNQQNHSVRSLRVQTSAHIGTDLLVGGNLSVLGTTTTIATSNLSAGSSFFRLNEGNAIGEAGTTFVGTGLDDAFYAGHFKGTTSQTYYVRIDGVGTGPGGVDTFEVALGNDSTFTSPTETKTPITGNPQLIHSTDNISIDFGATTGHDSGDRWSGTASPVNVDTGFFSNRNTGTSGVGYTHVGFFFDITDEKWKLIDEYDSTPTGTIAVTDSSLGTMVAAGFEGPLTGAVTGNASTATALASGRNFELTGQITASAVSFDGTGNVTLVTDIAAGVIKDSDINAAAAIADTKLATISTAGKVSNSATTATDANTNSAIVARDGSGNFSAGTVTLTDLHVGNLHVDSADIIKISRDNLVGGTGITYDSATGVISTTDGDIVHDNLSGFVANEHIDHTTVSVIAGNGLSGGGTIAADRTLNIDSANVRGMFSASGLSYNSGTGQFSVSATQVMDLIKTVDSNGSGLNAATLDGQEGSHYRINVFNAAGTLLN